MKEDNNMFNGKAKLFHCCNLTKLCAVPDHSITLISYEEHIY